ncbi:hypothetical protein FB45DRAFT_998282 [Roridomyces roridus]|uniref:F-box domain-containing protein n=1 Tax=Roridomyces roridus TaxID=1738132 RepID=A0AAD7CEX0_9AGAR|nr:hypothetical protein FB45DRAFT_998282 [Roridomyces roridus]
MEKNISSHSPSSHEWHKIRGLIWAAEANIARIDSEIENLIRLRDREQDTVNTLKPLVAPIRQLPSELLLEVFQIAVNEARGWLKQVLAISAVCAHWRRLACTTPQLWTQHLEIRADGGAVYVLPPSLLATAKTILERSAPLPIPVIISGKQSPLSDFIFNLAPRWKSLRFHSDDQISKLSGVPADALQSLESLRLNCDSDISPFMIVFLGGTPPLRCLCQRSESEFLPNAVVSAHETEPWQPDGTRPGSSRHFGAIPWTPTPAPASDQITQLSRLKTLKLSLDNSPIAPLFAHLALPALTQLFIDSSYSEYTWSSAGFSAFQRRSPSIRQLTLIGPLNIPSEGFLSFIHESPCIEELHLDHCFAGPNAVDAALLSLQYSDTHTVHHAPRLQRLSIIDSEGHFDETMLERTICSRWWTDSQLRAPVARWASFRIVKEFPEDVQDFSESFREKIAQLREEGLDVSIDEFD